MSVTTSTHSCSVQCCSVKASLESCLHSQKTVRPFESAVLSAVQFVYMLLYIRNLQFLPVVVLKWLLSTVGSSDLPSCCLTCFKQGSLSRELMSDEALPISTLTHLLFAACWTLCVCIFGNKSCWSEMKGTMYIPDTPFWRTYVLVWWDKGW